MIPIRCFTCGKVIANMWEDFVKKTEEGEKPSKVLDDMGIKRYCCRRMILAHVDVVKIMAPYQ